MFKKKPSSKKIQRRNNEEVTGARNISRLLDQLSRRYTPLTVQVDGHDALFTSCCVGVEDEYVLLDELMPSVGHKWLQQERKLKVSGKLDGIDIEFSAELESIDETDNVITYYMPLPKLLIYRQRRASYRVNIPLSRRMRVIIDDHELPPALTSGVDDAQDDETDPYQGMTLGVLQDLSRGGAGIVFEEGVLDVDVGRIEECAIELSDDEWLYCSIELRYAKPFGRQNHQHIGARFAALHPAQSRLIGRFISELEREMLRKRSW